MAITNVKKAIKLRFGQTRVSEKSLKNLMFKKKQHNRKMYRKEKVFIDEFSKTNNRTEAYMTAFKNVKKRRTAGTKGSNLLKKDYIYGKSIH